METELFILIDLFDTLLDNIGEHISENPDDNHNRIVQRRFFEIRMKYEDIAEMISLGWNYEDYVSAVGLVKNRGYVSIGEISRKLNLIYRQSFDLVLEMEDQGIILKPNEKGVRCYNPEYKENTF